MPVILKLEAQDRWLGPEIQQAQSNRKYSINKKPPEGN